MPTPTPAYALTKAQTGYGDVVFMSIDGGTSWLQIMQTRNIQYANQQKDFVDTTTTTSTGGFKTSIGTLKDPGSFSFDLVFDPTDPGQTALAAAYDSGVQLQVKHQYKAPAGFVTGAVNSFVAEVAQCPLAGSSETAAAIISCSLKISGPITRTPAVQS